MSANIKYADPKEAAQWAGEGAVLVDVREPDERLRERIEGSVSVPMSVFDPKAVPACADRVLVVCRSGARAADATARLAAAGKANVYCIKGGINAWKAAGLPTTGRKDVPITLMRQVQIVAGGAVLAGTILGATVSPWFYIVPGFFGAGLLFAGLSGTCGMASMLSLMPWNRAPKTSTA